MVYILTDQWRAKATGYNGDPNANTPHIDQLAKESVDFANAIGTSPVYARSGLPSDGVFSDDDGHVHERRAAVAGRREYRQGV